MAVILGIDPGKAPDRFAICAVERVETTETIEGKPRLQTTYLVRHLERTPLGTPYPQSVARLVEIFDTVAAMTTGDTHVRVDSTGVGSPVVDLVRDALATRKRLAVTAVTFTSTDRIERSTRSEWRVGKAHLVSRLQVLLQQRLIRLPATQESKALARELLDYEIRVSDSASMQVGAFKTGAHDDLVTALGLTVLEDRKRTASGTIPPLRRLTVPIAEPAMRSPDSRVMAVDRDGWERR